MERSTVATTSDGWIRSVSPGFLELVGQQVEELARINLIDLVHPHDAAAARRLLGDAGAIGFEPTLRLHLFQADGTWGGHTVSVRTADDGRRILIFEPAEHNPVVGLALGSAPPAASDAVPNWFAEGHAAAAAAAPTPVAANRVPLPEGLPPATNPGLSTPPETSITASPPAPRSWIADRFPVIGSWLRDRNLSPTQLGAALAVILLGFVVRTWDLSSLPAGFHGDEGVTGLEAERILREGSIGVYSGSALGQPTGPFYLDAVTVGLFGNTIWATRILSAIAGTLVVAATYWVIQRRFDHRTGFACAFAAATMTWGIHFSRIAFGVAWWPLVVLLAVAAIAQAATDQSRRSWFIAGGLSAFGVYIYNSHWSFGPPVVAFVVLWLIAMLVARKRVRVDALAFGALGAFIVGFPMLQFIVNEDGFLNHFNVVSRRSSAEWIEAGVSGKIGLYADWYWETWRALLITPVFDGTDGSGINKPVPMAFGTVAVVGLVDVVRRHRSTFVAILLATLVLVPLSSSLTGNAIARRNYALSPLIAILAGFGAIALIDLASKTSPNRRAGAMAAVALAVVALFSGVLPYFTAFRNSTGPHGVFTYELTIAADAIRDAETDGPVYVNWFSPTQDFLYTTLEFLLDDTEGESRAPLGVGFVPDLDMTLADDRQDHAQIFVLIGDYVDELDRLRATNPTGTVIERRTQPRIIMYEVPAN